MILKIFILCVLSALRAFIETQHVHVVPMVARRRQWVDGRELLAVAATMWILGIEFQLSASGSS